jgi:hypothetical protein
MTGASMPGAPMPGAPAVGTAAEPAPAPDRATAADWVLVVLVCVLSAVVAVFGVFFLPAYAGSLPVPAVVVVTSAALAVLPRVSFRLTRGRMAAALAPVVMFFLVTIGLYLTTNPLYRGAAVTWQGWQFYLLVGLGAIVAAASLGLLWSEQVEAEMRTRMDQGPVNGR